VKSKYDHLTKEDLIGILIKRDAERKLGLVWERKHIDHENALNNDFVAMDFNPDHSVGTGPYRNILIEGDNFDALRYLNIAYKGRVKCIYIDPPFNTGRKDFIYNDKYVDEEDAFRHSKWLEFIYRRLLLAKDLLTDDGVIFVSIGDTEYANLSLLMDQVFPKMRVSTFVWRRRSGANDSKDRFVSVDHEYVLCYANKGFTFSGQIKDVSSYTNPDNDDRGLWGNDNLVKAHNFKQRPDAYYSIFNPETKTWYPGDPDNVWRFATKERTNGKKIRTKTIEQIIDEKRVLWPKEEQTVIYANKEAIEQAIQNGTAPKNLRIYLSLEDLRAQVKNEQAPERLLSYIEPLENWVGRKIGYGKPRYKRFLKDLKRTEKPISTWILPSSIKRADLEQIETDSVEALQVGFTSEGTALLTQMVGNKDFPYPKPMSLLKALIGQATDADSGHIVMDFFAGSGTTGHAVMALNDEDQGDRAFILISTTESTLKETDKNICRDITAKRLKAAIEGYSYRTPKGNVTVAGVSGEFAYLRTRRLPLENIHLDINHDQIWYALQLLHIAELSPYIKDIDYQILNTELLTLIYISELNTQSLSAVLKLANSAATSTVIYTWQQGVINQSICNECVAVRQIPEFLIKRFGGSIK
jgi:adenine-specific DNA-methyltransferase